MGRMYAVQNTENLFDAAGDLLFFTLAANLQVIIHEIRLSQTVREGDAEAEMLSVYVGRTTGETPVGTALVGGVTALDSTYPADGVAITGWDQTVGTAGVRPNDDPIIVRDSWNIQAGWLYLPTPETRFITRGATEQIFISIPDTPAALYGIQTSVIWEEF